MECVEASVALRRAHLCRRINARGTSLPVPRLSPSQTSILRRHLSIAKSLGTAEPGVKSSLSTTRVPESARLTSPATTSSNEPWKATVTERKPAGFLTTDLDSLIVREVKPDEYWEAADLHCAAFFPSAPFPLDFLLRSDRVSNILSGLSIPQGRNRKCLVAIEPQSTLHGNTSVVNPVPPAFLPTNCKNTLEQFDSEKDILGGPLLRPVVASLMLGPPVVSWTSSGLNVGPRGLVGSVTVDTAAEYLPKELLEGPTRNGVAYISNMAVRAVRRRRGIASLLLRKAEDLARVWGCTACALHCNILDEGAMGLYLRHGYRPLKPSIGAVWPEPPVGDDQELNLMVKEL